jgi:glucokinase
MALTVGVDVGGTKIAAGVVDQNGTILEDSRRPSPADDPGQLLDTIAQMVADLGTRHEVTGVGLAAAGFVSADRRSTPFAPHLQRGDRPVADLLEEAVALPVVVENDANAAAWAEFLFGAGRGVPDQLMVALGTEVGGGLILGGELYRGSDGAAAEIGHFGLVRNGRRCKCGRDGCFEEYASSRALQREARTAAADGAAPNLLAAAGGDPEAVTGAMVTELAQAGEPEALALFADFGDALGVGIASLVAVLDPTLVVIAGGVGAAGEMLLEPTGAALAREWTSHGNRPGPELRIAELGNDAALVGAADLVRCASPTPAVVKHRLR